MICLLCLFRAAAGSMPVACMLLWTEGQRVNGSMYVCQENFSPPQQLNSNPEYPWRQFAFLDFSSPWWQKPWTHSASSPYLPHTKVASYVGRMVSQFFRTFTSVWIFHYYNNVIWPVLWVSRPSHLTALKMSEPPLPFLILPKLDCNEKGHYVPFYQHDLDPVLVSVLQGQVISHGLAETTSAKDDGLSTASPLLTISTLSYSPWAVVDRDTSTSNNTFR